MSVRLISLAAAPLSVALREPFIIASGRIDTTRAVLVNAVLADAQSGERAAGLGEAAALPPVTREDQPDTLAAISALGESLLGTRFGDLSDLTRVLDARLPGSSVARAGVECALLDAWAKLAAKPLCEFLGGGGPRTLITDITLPITAPERMAELAVGYRAQGFDTFKVKVGRNLDDDIRALHAVHARVGDARFRLDANAGFDARQALELMAAARSAHLPIECFEQPCRTGDWDGMAQVTREAGVPVIADESVQSLADLAQLVRVKAGHGVNLKLAKAGGPIAALALGRAAKREGLHVMCGGMVETRLGMSAMAHVACALEGADYIDLDTAFLLAHDPFDGGYEAHGAELRVSSSPGIGVTERG